MAFCNRVKFGPVIFSLGVAAYMESVEGGLEHVGGARSPLDPVALGPKSMRKTWESWFVASYSEKVLEVFLSQGHSQMTALSHYLGLPFTQADKVAMLEHVSGWAWDG